VAREETAEAHMVAPPSKHVQMETRICHCGKKAHVSRVWQARMRAEQQSSHAKALMAGLGASSSTAWLVDWGASHRWDSHEHTWYLVCSDRKMLTNVA
jgi:hypothetical protein